MNGSRVLIVEDDAIQSFRLNSLLIKLGYQVAGQVATGEDAIQAALAEIPDVILMDINLRSAMTGIQAAAAIHAQMSVPVIYLTAYNDEAWLNDAKTRDGYAFLAKPVRDSDLRASLEMALYKYSVEKRIEHLNRVLRAIRSVNQLTTRERDPARLQAAACQILLQTRDYEAVWIYQPSGQDPSAPQAGQVEQAFAEYLSGQAKTVSEETFARQTAVIPMLHNSRLYGHLCVLTKPAAPSQPDQAPLDLEETDLLRELAEDVAYALFAIQEEAARQRVEAMLRGERDRLSKIAATVPGVILSFQLRPDGSTAMPFASSAVEDVYGLTPDEIRTDGSLILNAIHPDDLPHVQAKITESARQMTPLRATYRFAHPLKGEVWIEGASMPVGEPDGSIIWHGFVYDVSERMRAEEAVRESEERYRLIVESAVAGIVVHVDNRIVYGNSAALEMIGAGSFEQIRGRNVIEFIHPDDQAGVIAQISAGLLSDPAAGKTNAKPVVIEERLIRLDGTIITVEASALLINYYGKIGLLTMLSDITRRR